MDMIYRLLNALRVWMVTRRFPAWLIRPISAACVCVYYRERYGKKVRET